MKRAVVMGILMVAGCSEPGNLRLSLGSDDSATAAISAPSMDHTGRAMNLTAARSIKVTITEVLVHIAEGEAGPSVTSAQVPDDAPGWQAVATGPMEIDLAKVRDDGAIDLADVDVPEGRIDAVRIRLASHGVFAGVEDRIIGAVIDANGAVCDLIVPRAVVDAGAKVDCLYKPIAIATEGTTAQLNFKLRSSQRAEVASGCAFRLAPVIQLVH